jgi:glyoxylate/hydroxypyruvate reductase A
VGHVEVSELPEKTKLVLFDEGAMQFENAIAARHPDVNVVKVSAADITTADCTDARAAIGWRFPPVLLGRMPGLKWVQSLGVGVEDLIAAPELPTDAVITNTKGIYSDEVAEYIVWALITLSRRLDEVLKNQRRRRWEHIIGRSISGKTIGIVGIGHLGSATARYASALGMKVVGFGRSAAPSGVEDWFDSVIPVADIDPVLGDLDAIVICLPLTDQTRGLIGRDRIARLKQGAILVNVGREEIVDYRSLLDAVRSGHIAGAALDVFEKEPLRRLSPWWRAPNILVTPHISALTHDYKIKVAELVVDNVARFVAGTELRGLVDRVKGY